MPKHSLVVCWLHLVWSTKERFPYFIDKDKALKCRDHLIDICSENKIYLKKAYVNPEHVHLLVSLPVDMTIKDMLRYLKGGSSFRMNEEKLFKANFSWARGYAAFSVSLRGVERVEKYIGNQAEHHRKKSFTAEWEEFTQECEKNNLIYLVDDEADLEQDGLKP
ncbi:MAG: IS200/IS605 family transposase [Candidatus Cloacimonetes bacterium]|nr:IS200/IS605 family transposase [Candidatus Cloacimonadota bacterium]